MSIGQNIFNDPSQLRWSGVVNLGNSKSVVSVAVKLKGRNNRFFQSCPEITLFFLLLRPPSVMLSFLKSYRTFFVKMAALYHNLNSSLSSI